MGIKRKRGVKTEIPLSEGDYDSTHGEISNPVPSSSADNTFINNSDYNSLSNQPSPHGNSFTNEDNASNPFLESSDDENKESDHKNELEDQEDPIIPTSLDKAKVDLIIPTSLDSIQDTIPDSAPTKDTIADSPTKDAIADSAPTKDTIENSAATQADTLIDSISKLDDSKEIIKSGKDQHEANGDNDSDIFEDARGSEINSPASSDHSDGKKVTTKETESKVSVSVEPTTSLSYSQQQSDVLLQSPSKRREIHIPKRPNEPRLMIDKLVLTNFKSYAGVQVIGPFNASFSAVVGPNGSGKSNVIDSLLFVFGFRALKMRQGKLSELIHNSSDGEKFDYCQVDIHFKYVLDDPQNNNKPAEVIPNSELVISRKAFRNNQSLYYVDYKPSNYTEVTTYLKEKGIDLDHKRFLILQGEVESIAQMKSKAEKENDDGLLEYLEDIIGTSKYKQLIEDNLNRMDELNEVCLEKENRFELVEKDKDLLEDKKNDALKYLLLEKQLISKRSIQHQANIYENNKVLEDHEAGLKELSEKLESEKSSNIELMKAIEEFTQKQQGIKDTVALINDEITALTKRRREVNRKNVALDEKVKNLSGKMKKVIKSKELLEHSISSATLDLQQRNDASQKYRLEMEELTKNLDLEKAKLDEIRKSLTAKTSEFSNQIATLHTKLLPWNDKLKANENACLLAKSALELLITQKDSTEKQLSNAKQRLIDIKTEGKAKEAEFRETEANLSKIINQIALGREQCELDKQELEKKKLKVSSARERAQEAAKSLSNFENKNKVLSSLLRLAKSGRIDGFHGRLGDLGVIDDVYDIAISTACPGLDSMVVDTVETAQACIDYLRKNKLGYANFICLNKLRKFNLDPIQTPGNPAVVKRLFDLIRPNNQKFAAAFYSKLYNTLVAPDLNEAKKVAYGAKRWKVVTLDGKVVDTSGAMSGGGNYFAKGGMRTTNSTAESAMDISPDDVELMWTDAKQLESDFEESEATYKTKEDMLKQLLKLKPETEFAISRLQLDIESLSSEKKEVTATCRALIAEIEDHEKRKQLDEQIQAKEEEVRGLESQKVDLKSEMKEMESQIKVLEGKIMDAGGVELKVQNSKVDSIKQKLEIIDDKTAGDRMAIRKLENDIKRFQKNITQATEELQSCENQLEQVQQELREVSKLLEEITTEITSAEDKKNDLESDYEAIRVELEEKNEQINKFKSFEIEIENKMEKHRAYIQRATRNIEDSKNALQELIIRDVKPLIDWMEESEQKEYDGASFEELDAEALKDIDLDDINSDIENLETSLGNIKVDVEVLKEYGLKKNEYESRKNDLNSAVNERDNIKNYCEDLKRKRLDEFMEGFNTISMTLKDMYRMITMGGNAELELVDSLDPFSEGILFSVMPPKKSWKNISNLSGGEKTLSSLALVFALHQYKPTPLYVMDEIDAALDFRNVSIVANYIKERTKNAQFIVISLRNNMFELAQQLVGIYKINNRTKSISLQNKDFLVSASD